MPQKDRSSRMISTGWNQSNQNLSNNNISTNTINNTKNTALTNSPITTKYQGSSLKNVNGVNISSS